MSADAFGQLTHEQRAELRQRAIDRSKRRRFGLLGPGGPRPPDGGEPLPVERAA